MLAGGWWGGERCRWRMMLSGQADDPPSHVSSRGQWQSRLLRPMCVGPCVKCSQVTCETPRTNPSLVHLYSRLCHAWSTSSSFYSCSWQDDVIGPYYTAHSTKAISGAILRQVDLMWQCRWSVATCCCRLRWQVRLSVKRLLKRQMMGEGDKCITGLPSS